MNVEFDLLLDIQLEWIIGIGEIIFWEKRINNQLTIIDDIMTPGGGSNRGWPWTKGVPGDFGISSTLRALCVFVGGTI